jgi:hypothetical protein
VGPGRASSSYELTLMDHHWNNANVLEINAIFFITSGPDLIVIVQM